MPFGGIPAALGTVFALTPPASAGGAWTETVIHSFAGSGSDGADPTAGLAIGAGGVLYGTTYYGGNGSACYLHCGALYSLTPTVSTDGAWRETLLHNFSGYTFDGGSSGFGAVFEAGPDFGSKLPKRAIMARETGGCSGCYDNEKARWAVSSVG
jgi:hypothetical protein